MSKERRKIQSQRENSESELFTSPGNSPKQVVQTSYSGPLPTSSELANYERIVPGSAERIIRMAESYAGHQQSIESKIIEYTRAESSSGQIIAAILVVVILSVCLVALLYDYEDFATTLGSWTIVSLAIVFVTGKISKWLNVFRHKT
jgi:uncharacterized membrane protein